MRSAERQEGRKFRTEEGTGWRGEYRSPSSWESDQGPGSHYCHSGLAGDWGGARDNNQQPEKAQGPAGAPRLCPQRAGPAPRLYTPPPSYPTPSQVMLPSPEGALQQSLCAGWPGHPPLADCGPTAGSLLPVWRGHTTGRPRVQNPWGLDPQNTALPTAPGNPWTRAAGESGVSPGRDAAPALGQHSCVQ